MGLSLLSGWSCIIIKRLADRRQCDPGLYKTHLLHITNTCIQVGSLFVLHRETIMIIQFYSLNLEITILRSQQKGGGFKAYIPPRRKTTGVGYFLRQVTQKIALLLYFWAPGVGAGVGHVHFKFFVLISFAFGSQRKPSFQWNMGCIMLYVYFQHSQ